MEVCIEKAENLEAEIDASGILTMVIDTKKVLGRSQSGRNTIISTTHGQDFFLTPDGRKIKINLNVYA